jgi:hypothetical protein
MHATYAEVPRFLGQMLTASETSLRVVDSSRLEPNPDDKYVQKHFVSTELNHIGFLAAIDAANSCLTGLRQPFPEFITDVVDRRIALTHIHNLNETGVTFTGIEFLDDTRDVGRFIELGFKSALSIFCGREIHFMHTSYYEDLHLKVDVVADHENIGVSHAGFKMVRNKTADLEHGLPRTNVYVPTVMANGGMEKAGRFCTDYINDLFLGDSIPWLRTAEFLYHIANYTVNGEPAEYQKDIKHGYKTPPKIKQRLPDAPPNILRLMLQKD